MAANSSSANPNTNTNATTADTLVSIKVAIDGTHRRFKVSLRDLGAQIFHAKMRTLLEIPLDHSVIFERYSDSAGAFVTLDANDPAVFKQLYRAAKAKLKLRIRATVIPPLVTEAPPAVSAVADAVVDKPNGDVGPLVDLSTSAIQDTTTALETSETIPSPPTTTPAVVETPLIDNKPEVPTLPNMAPASAPVHRSSEAPVPDPFSVRGSFLSSVAQSAQAHYLAIMSGDNYGHGAPSTMLPIAAAAAASYMVYCNHCDDPITKEYYHCSTCDGGDFDLCRRCVDAGQLCNCEGHWLIKRTIKDGQIINSTTETVSSRKSAASTIDENVKSKAAPPASTHAAEVETATLARDGLPTRVCNHCMEYYLDGQLVNCTTCPDYDLCLACLELGHHGHHPAHEFAAVLPSVTLDPVSKALCAPGRNIRHHALCDGCDQTIVGIRHKCLDCPDWDYCVTCFRSIDFIHPGHRFVKVMEPLPPRMQSYTVHAGKLCDGPLCKAKGRQTWIVGDCYKCCICHDTDFCADCEASPINTHNKTHPMIKFKTPVREATVSTFSHLADGSALPTMGDWHAHGFVPSEATVPVMPRSSRSVRSATTHAPRTTIDIKRQVVPGPFTPTTPVQATTKMAETKAPAVVVETKPAVVLESQLAATEVKPTEVVPAADALNAHFKQDTIADGTVLPPNHVFRQTWILRNPGPADWPQGCSVRFVGGDNMRNIDTAHPISVADLEKSVESDVLPLALGVGLHWSFTVTLKTPKRRGKYISYWRLTTPEGIKFGHKLWCEIDVQGDQPKVVQPTVEPTMSTKTLPVRSSASSIPKAADWLKVANELLEKVGRQNAELNEEMKSDREANGESVKTEGNKLEMLQLTMSRIKAMSELWGDVDSPLPVGRRNVKREDEKEVTEKKEDEPKEETETKNEKPDAVVEKKVEQETAVEAEVKKEKIETDSSSSAVEGSAMIFPTLETESSVGEEAAVTETNADETKKNEQQEEDHLEEVVVEDEQNEEMFEMEEVNLDGDDSDDEFLTDEEYDILDASDEEFLNVGDS
ncbi:MAG: hypothetical protein M1823_004368 [Watsoniomyces obsoletus]|nr:MAG: hypothetical protein M1823_004368 [Watsoniomyces obsoletus]